MLNSTSCRWSVLTGFFAVAAVAAVAAAVVVAAGCDRQEPREASGPPRKLTLAVSPQPVSAPVFVAREKGFFAREGLEVTFQPYASGKDALDAVIHGRADFGTTAETPVMLAALNGDQVRVLATIAESDRYMKIIARRDRGILGPADLKGKRIAASPGTNAEFFLHVCLIMNHLKDDDVTMVPLGPDEMPGALTEGAVDAVSTWVPHTTALEERLSDNAVVIGHADLYYTMTWNLAAGAAAVQADPQVAVRLLRAIVSAEGFIEEHPDEAMAITAGQCGMDAAELRAMWGIYTYRTRLDHSLILNLEDQARWTLQRRPGGDMPDLSNYVYPDALRAVRPEAVRLAGD